MLPTLKAALALLSLLQLVSSKPLVTTSPRHKLSEITHRIQQLNSGAQVPCNDTRVAQVPFTDHKLSEQELLCQAATALARVTRCRKDYEPFCSLSNENEIYLRNFLPELGNFTQGLYRRLAAGAAQ
ncbi:hypothetical protein N339_08462 [Pterocles gutturalis]|uniref:Interleukin-4 n=1 Tax=Pterocles gutturalis TaxID=240206 RepID=A0A093BPN9_9AVES|nr:hypothetical protein N339_08462 [Pterocles gutturalis]